MSPPPSPPRSRTIAAAAVPRALLASAALTLVSCGLGDGTTTIDQAVHMSCATVSTVRGVDVSIYQGTIDWPAAARGGIRFAFIRQSHGMSADTNFTRNWNGARAAGILRGSYQYFNPWTDANAQAVFFSNALMAAGFGPGDLPPVLDVEQPSGAGDPPLPTATEYAMRVRTWVNAVRMRLGVDPIIYTGGYYWDGNVRTNEFASLPLWHAQYFNYPGTIYNVNVMPLPNGGCATSVSNAWPRWTFWQFAGGNGRAPGFSGAVDCDVFNGTIEQLRTLARIPVMNPDAGVADAGPRPDASTTDASATDGAATDGAPAGDAATTDDGLTRDAAGDDARPTDEGGANVDTGTSPRDGSADGSVGDGGMTRLPGGCGCRVPSSSPSPRPFAIAATIAALATFTRGRIRRRRATR